MRRTSKKNPWSFKIDYDKAIAEDERVIALYTRALDQGVFKPEAYVAQSWTLVHLLIHNSVVADELSVTREDLCDLMIFSDIDADAIDTDFISPFHGDLVELTSTRPSGAYARGKAVAKRLETVWADDDLLTAAQLASCIKKAKTDLARHKRNNLKHG